MQPAKPDGVSPRRRRSTTLSALGMEWHSRFLTRVPLPRGSQRPSHSFWRQHLAKEFAFLARRRGHASRSPFTPSVSASASPLRRRSMIHSLAPQVTRSAACRRSTHRAAQWHLADRHASFRPCVFWKRPRRVCSTARGACGEGRAGRGCPPKHRLVSAPMPVRRCAGSRIWTFVPEAPKNAAQRRRRWWPGRIHLVAMNEVTPAAARAPALGGTGDSAVAFILPFWVPT